MAEKSPTPKSAGKTGKTKRKKKSGCEHIVYGPLLAAKEEHEFTWNEAFDGDTSRGGSKNHLYMAFYRLKEFAIRSREEPLKNTDLVAVKKIIDYIAREKKMDVSLLRALAAGKSIIGKTPVEIYVQHIDSRIRAAKDDPILKRVALEAKARAFELERKWADAGTTLESIAKIEGENLCDPVEAARTSARAAEAYIDCEQYCAARRVLEAAVKGVKDMPTVVRTKIELLLAQAHLHLKEGNYLEGISVLTDHCESLLRQLCPSADSPPQFLKLRADFDVRLGALLKRTATSAEATDIARGHLLKGAIARAKLKAPLNTAHAVRHVGGIFWRAAEIKTGVSSPSGFTPESVAVPKATELPPEQAFTNIATQNSTEVKALLTRSLWFYCSALVIFQTEHDEEPQARNHLHCGNVLTLLAALCRGDDDDTQRVHLRQLKEGIRNQFNDIAEASQLATLLIDAGFEPENSGGKHPFARPYAEAARSHFEHCITLADKHGKSGLKQEGERGLESLTRIESAKSGIAQVAAAKRTRKATGKRVPITRK